MLDRCDRVVLLNNGRVVAEGTHRHLLRSEPGYRDVVARDSDALGDEALEASR